MNETDKDPVPARKRRRILWRILLLLAALFLAASSYFLATAAGIYFYSPDPGPGRADAAIVLGAALLKNEPAPVFKERINHAIHLHRTGAVKKIVLTGGFGEGSKLSDAAVARRYAIRNGVSEGAIIIEEESHTTLENFSYALEAVRGENLKSFLIVSDPIHMKRAMMIARNLGIQAYPSPTPTTRYRSFATKFRFLMRETRYLLRYRLSRLR